MFNPYLIILTLFLIAGLIATLWGWLIIRKASKTKHWPSVDGVVVESRMAGADSDLLPHIHFSYTIDQSQHQTTQEFPPDITPTREFAESYIQKYPPGAAVKVYYNPANPSQATLEPGLARGDWLVLAFGVSSLVLAVVLFFLGG